MKRILILFIASIFVGNLFSQHISFMGIQLGQSEKVVDRMLRQKGFAFDGKINYTENMRYRGPFWIFDEVLLSSNIENKKVTEIVLSPIIGTYDTKSDYDNIVHNLDKKYGQHHSISSFFKYSDIADHEGFYWKVSGGYIVVYYVNKPSSDNRIMIYVDYLDNTNKSVLLEKGRRRNTNNDL